MPLHSTAALTAYATAARFRPLPNCSPLKKKDFTAWHVVCIDLDAGSRKSRRRIKRKTGKKDMENSIYTGLSRQIALQEQMDMVSNNIANMNTPGYRGQNMVFTEYLSKPSPQAGKQQPLSMVMDYGQYMSTASGPLQQTGNPLDVALQGPGYFGVQTPQGVMYTRAGNFQINANGDLTTGSGQLVASPGGSTITIPKDATEIKISEDGTVATESGAVGQIMVVEFTNDQELEAAGNGLYKAKSAGNPAQNSRVMQGMIEGSNINPVLEMTRMLNVLRSYQATQNMIQSEHERERGMIQRLTR